MTTTFNGYKITVMFKGDKAAPWKVGGEENLNRHVVTVKHIRTNRRISFDYWASLARPRIETETELLEAFECFVSDANAAEMELDDFAKDFGYTEVSEAVRVYKACQKSHEKSRKIGLKLYSTLEKLRAKLEG